MVKYYSKAELQQKGRDMKRSEVPVEQTWDLSLIYRSDDDAWSDAEMIRKITERLEKKYKGNLTDADSIIDCLHLYERLRELADNVSIYFGLKVETDYSDAGNAASLNKAESMLTECLAKTTFIENEIIQAGEDVIKEAVEKGGSVSVYLKKILKGKPHKLSTETETVLASLSDFMETPYQVYNQAKLADMHFDDFTVNGKQYPLTYSLFEDNYEYEKDTDVRRAAFRHFSDKLKAYENVTAAAYNAYVLRDKRLSDARGFDNVFEYLLFDEDVTRDMYDRQIDVIMEKLAPHMRKYAGLIKKVHGLDRITYADLKLPVDPEYSPEVSIDEAERYISDGLSVMGDEYISMIRKAFRNRWIDTAANDGKCTGGFCESPYGVPASFILLTFQHRMADVFTLAHELGHAGHFMYCNEAQGYFDVQVPMYYVESPSTINELLMTG